MQNDRIGAAVIYNMDPMENGPQVHIPNRMLTRVGSIISYPMSHRIWTHLENGS